MEKANENAKEDVATMEQTQREREREKKRSRRRGRDWQTVKVDRKAFQKRCRQLVMEIKATQKKKN